MPIIEFKYNGIHINVYRKIKKKPSSYAATVGGWELCRGGLVHISRAFRNVTKEWVEEISPFKHVSDSNGIGKFYLKTSFGSYILQYRYECDYNDWQFKVEKYEYSNKTIPTITTLFIGTCPDIYCFERVLDMTKVDRKYRRWNNQWVVY